jgi:hypothetical protein
MTALSAWPAIPIVVLGVLAIANGCASSQPGDDSAAGAGGGAGAASRSMTCPGGSAVDPAFGCRNGSDCGSVYHCEWYLTPSPASQGQGCLIGLTGVTYRNECDTDASCGAGRVCEHVPAALGYCPDDILCVAACTLESCPSGQRCADSGHCEPIPCADGFTCPPGTVCSPDPAADANGCTPISCADGWVCSWDTTCQARGANPSSHDCVPTACEDGFPCSPGKHCDARALGDEHGCRTWCSETGCLDGLVCGEDEICVSKTCMTDADCPCGVCGDKICRPNLGLCAGTGGTSG